MRKSFRRMISLVLACLVLLQLSGLEVPVHAEEVADQTSVDTTHETEAGHTAVTIPGKAPTATESGLTDGEKCSVCGEVLRKQQMIPAAYSEVDLPEGYERVPYLESLDGAYIDTGLAALPGDQMILYAAAISNDNMSLMGSGTTSSSNDRIQAHHVRNGGYTLRFFGQMSNYVQIPFGRMVSFVFDLENGLGYFDGKLVLEQPAEVLPVDESIYLFAKNVGGQIDPKFSGSCRVYGYKHYRDGAAVRDMVPCYRKSDGVYGMYDSVEGKFYTNDGEGSLSYEALELIGEGGIVMDMESGEIYYGKNIHWKNAMGSTTKLMTCILALENLDLNARTLPVIESDLLPLGSNMGLVVGESLNVLDALYGLIIPSGCDAAQLLARTVAGDYDAFVDMMNAKAAELGMTETLYSCPSGLDDEIQYTTVYDMTKLMRYAMQNEVFRKLIAAKSYQIKADDQGARDHTMATTNDVLKNYEGCFGAKTGTTTASGGHMVAVARRHGSNLVAVILSSYPNNRYSDMSKLFDYGFAKISGHVYTLEVTAPTCTEQGYTTYTCSDCGYSCVENYVPATGHKYNETVIAPTCTKQGYTINICANCGFEYVDDYVAALGHDEVIIAAVAPTCTATGLTEGSYCAVCGKVFAAQKTVGMLGHSYRSVVTSPTCTAEGYTTYTCECGESYVDAKVAALGHALGEWTTVTEPKPGAAGEERRDCERCDHFETRAIPYQGNAVMLEGEDLTNQKEVWIEGMPYPVITVGNEQFVELPTAEDCILVTYTYQNADNSDVHTQYPTGMKVYKVSSGKITHIQELDNLLQYSGSSIRITGKKGIRMITSLTKANKAALTGSGLAGYKLLEYGTALCWASEIKEGDALVLGKSFARSNYAYKRGVADPVFATTKDLVQYTNVLVGFTNDQCKDDIAMRPYIILEDAKGEKITLYGGTVYRSIGYIAYQNRNVVRQGTEAYKYVWDIIHYVYGNQYDADYKG